MHASHTLGDGCASRDHGLSHCTRCCLTGHRAVSLSLRHSASCLPDPGSLPRSGALQLSGSVWTLIGPWVHACVIYTDLCAHRHEYSIWPVPLITSDRNLTLRLAAGMCVPWSSRKSRGSYETPPGLLCCLSFTNPKPDTNCVPYTSALKLRVCSDVSHKCQIPRSPTLPFHYPFSGLGILRSQESVSAETPGFF